VGCWGWGFSSVVERLPSKRKALSSVPSSRKKKREKKREKKKKESGLLLTTEIKAKAPFAPPPANS